MQPRANKTSEYRKNLPALREWLFLTLLGAALVGLSSNDTHAQENSLSSMASRFLGGQWGETIDLNDPCPNPATSPAPGNDMALLQADIDRFSLCAERAESLKRFNEAALGKNADQTAASPENPGFKLRGRKDAEGKEEVKVPPVSEESLAPSPSEKTPRPKDPGEWVILNIFGSGNGLQVRLRKKDGSVAQAKTGSVLPDGWTVSQVSTSGIILTKDGQNKTLTWMD